MDVRADKTSMLVLVIGRESFEYNLKTPTHTHHLLVSVLKAQAESINLPCRVFSSG